MQLQKATPTEKELALRIIFSSLAVSAAPSYSAEFIEKIKGVYVQRVERYISEGALFLVEAGDKTIGTVGLYANEVKTLFIDPLHQGRGYGKYALLEVEKIAKTVGYDVLHLDALVNAVGFYVKMGFSLTEHIIKRAEFNKNLSYPVARMKKILR